MKLLKNFEVRVYLERWVDNVGFSSSPEMTLLTALRETHSLVDWFGSGDVDYNEDFALETIRELWEHK